MDFGAYDGGRAESIGASLATTIGTSVTPSASANTKGAWAQLIAVTAFDATGILVWLNSQGPGQDVLFDIGVGGAGVEQVLIENVPTAEFGGNVGHVWYFPIEVPAGSRISARAQVNAAGAGTLFASAMMLAGGMKSPQVLGRVTTYGANTADSGGVQIDPGGVVNTKGLYSEIVASTTNPIKKLIISHANQNNSVRLDARWFVDIAVGGAGSEQIIISNVFLICSANIDRIMPTSFPPIDVEIPAGTRIAARAQCSITDATGRLFDLLLHGVD